MATFPPQTMIYVGSNDGFIYALESHDGSQVWKYQCDPAPVSMPAINKNVVCARTVNGVLYALQKSSGSLLWRQPLPRFSSPPALTSVSVYVCADDRVYAFHAENGSQQWQYQIQRLAPIKPIAIGDHLYVRSTVGSVYALRASDGFRLWQLDTEEDIALPMAASEEHVCIPRPDGMVLLLRATDGSPIWHHATNYFSPFDPTIIRDVVYLDSLKGIEALQTHDGASLWHFSTSLSIASPVRMIGETVYASAGRSSQFAVYALQARSGTLQWQWGISCGDGGISPPAEGNGTVYVSIMNKCGVYALDSQNGNVRWHTLNDVLLTMPVVG